MQSPSPSKSKTGCVQGLRFAKHAHWHSQLEIRLLDASGMLGDQVRGGHHGPAVDIRVIERFE
jgi:hypothetical protein